MCTPVCTRTQIKDLFIIKLDPHTTQTRTYTYVRASTHTCACAHTHIKDLFIIELDPHRLRRALGGQPFADASLNPGYVVSGICVPPLMPHVVFELYVLTPKP